VSPAVLTKAPLVKQGQRRNPVLATAKTNMRSVSSVSFDFQSFQMTKHAETKMLKATKGQVLTIRSRIPTGIHAATTSVAQIEFAAIQNRQLVTKLDENEGDEVAEFRLCLSSGKKLLMYRLALIVTLMLVNESAFRSRHLRSQVSRDDCNASQTT
jgi:hypothetical protein